MESKNSTVNTTKQTTSTSESPTNTLNDSVGTLTSGNHNTVLNNVGKGKKKTGKKRKPNTGKNVSKKTKKRKTKSRKKVSKGNLKPTDNNVSGVIGNDTVNGLDGPREGNNTTVKGQFSRPHVVSRNKEISNNILGGYQNETEEEIHHEDINVQSSIGKVNVAWEHFGLLVEEYLLAIDVHM